MKFGLKLKEIRNKHKDSLATLGEKLGVSNTYVTKIEQGISPASENFFLKLLEVYHSDRNELTKSYLQETLPPPILDKIVFKENTGMMSITPTFINKIIQVYCLDTSGDGILLQEPKTRELIIPMIQKLNENNIYIEITGEEYEPNFYKKDVILVEPSTSTWQQLNKKIVVISKDGYNYVKKVEIVDYEVKFYSLNGLYPPIENTEGVELIGVFKQLLSRDLYKIKY